MKRTGRTTAAEMSPTITVSRPEAGSGKAEHLSNDHPSGMPELTTPSYCAGRSAQLPSKLKQASVGPPGQPM